MSLNVYTDRSQIPKDIKVENKNDAFFNLYNRIFKKPLNTGFISI